MQVFRVYDGITTLADPDRAGSAQSRVTFAKIVYIKVVGKRNSKWLMRPLMALSQNRVDEIYLFSYLILWQVPRLEHCGTMHNLCLEENHMYDLWQNDFCWSSQESTVRMIQLVFGV